MRDICHYYKRYRKWNRVLIEIGIRPGSDYYNPFMTGLISIADIGTNIIVPIVTITTGITILKNTSVINGMMMTMMM